MNDAVTLAALLAAQPAPPCAALMPHEIIDADLERGYIRLRFAEQRAFENHFAEPAALRDGRRNRAAAGCRSSIWIIQRGLTTHDPALKHGCIVRHYSRRHAVGA